MRHHQARFVHPGAAIQNQVEVEGARRARRRSFTPILPFNVEQPIQQRAGRQAGLTHDDAVQVAWLFADADWRRVVPRGVPEVREDRGQAADGEGEVRLAIAEVAAQGDRDGGRRGYSPVQRSAMTTPL
jgi:hypothetical protein